MQSFLVLASLVSELAGGQNDPPSLNVTKNTLVLFKRVKVISIIKCPSAVFH